MARGARAALMRQNSLQLVVTAVIGTQICTATRHYLSVHHVSINSHVKVHVYTPSGNEKASYFTSFGASTFWLSCGSETRRIITHDFSTHRRTGECAKSYLLLLFLQLFVLHVLEPGPHRHHFFLQLSSAQLVHVQHEGELHILNTQQRELWFNSAQVRGAGTGQTPLPGHLVGLPEVMNLTFRTLALTDSFSL